MIFFRVIFRGMWLKSHPCDNLRKSRRRAIFSFFFSFHDNFTRKRFLVIFHMADTSFHTQHIHTHAQTYIKYYKKFKILRTFFRCSLWNFLKFILIRGMKNTLELYFIYQYSRVSSCLYTRQSSAKLILISFGFTNSSKCSYNFIVMFL